MKKFVIYSININKVMDSDPNCGLDGCVGGVNITLVNVNLNLT